MAQATTRQGKKSFEPNPSRVLRRNLKSLEHSHAASRLFSRGLRAWPFGGLHELLSWLLSLLSQIEYHSTYAMIRYAVGTAIDTVPREGQRG